MFLTGRCCSWDTYDTSCMYPNAVGKHAPVMQVSQSLRTHHLLSRRYTQPPAFLVAIQDEVMLSQPASAQRGVGHSQ